MNKDLNELRENESNLKRQRINPMKIQINYNAT